MVLTINNDPRIKVYEQEDGETYLIENRSRRWRCIDVVVEALELNAGSNVAVSIGKVYKDDTEAWIINPLDTTDDLGLTFSTDLTAINGVNVANIDNCKFIKVVVTGGDAATMTLGVHPVRK